MFQLRSIKLGPSLPSRTNASIPGKRAATAKETRVQRQSSVERRSITGRSIQTGEWTRFIQTEEEKEENWWPC